jgi:hypothetical protein
VRSRLRGCRKGVCRQHRHVSAFHVCCHSLSHSRCQPTALRTDVACRQWTFQPTFQQPRPCLKCVTALTPFPGQTHSDPPGFRDTNMCVLTKAEETLRIDREGCLMCSIGFMAVPPFRTRDESPVDVAASMPTVILTMLVLMKRRAAQSAGSIFLLPDCASSVLVGQDRRS